MNDKIIYRNTVKTNNITTIDININTIKDTYTVTTNMKQIQIQIQF